MPLETFFSVFEDELLILRWVIKVLAGYFALEALLCATFILDPYCVSYYTIKHHTCQKGTDERPGEN